MRESGLSKIGIVGIGTMGNGIAQVCAQFGFDTVVVDVTQAIVDRGLDQIRRSLDRLVASYEKSGGEKGISAADRDAAIGRLHASASIDALLDRDLIIEAIVEKEEAKAELYRNLVAKGYQKLLASNTSSISITRLAAAYGKPELFMGMHFMNPVPLQKGVEIIRGLMTSDATSKTIVGLCHDLDKIEIPSEDKAGFTINRMWLPFVNEAVRIVEEGLASVDDVDKCTYCLGHKMGPLTTADYVGLDVCLFVCDVLEAEFGSAYMASPLLKRLVEAGCLGVKSGMGFYKWAEGKPVSVNPAVARYRIK